MIITRTPLRISFLGGNTDFPAYFKEHGGAVLTATIDKYIYCIVKERFDDQIWINYSIKEIVDSVDDIKHELVREAMKLTGVDRGVEISFLSDIPSQGSGLGSSSAVAVGVLNVLHQLKGESVSAKQLAEEACHIEIEILKKPIGVQDQYAVAFGGTNFIELNDKITIVQQDLSYLNNYLMLLYTGITRKASDILSRMKLDNEILDKNKKLAYSSLNSKQTYVFGALLNEYWGLKKILNEATSNDFIDELYQKALHMGAYGGKIVGAGGGGFLLLVVPPEKRVAIRATLGLKELPFRFSRYGSKVIFDIND